MTMKRKSTIEIFHIHKRVKEAPDGDVPPPNPLGSPCPPVAPNPADKAESSNAQIRREAVEEYKRSSEFRDLVDEAGAQSFVEGFYACRRWINYHSPQLELKGYTFSTIPLNFRYPLYNYLAEVEMALAEKEEEERREAEEDTEEAEEEVEEELPADGEEVDGDLTSEEEEEKEKEKEKEEEEIEEEED